MDLSFVAQLLPRTVPRLLQQGQKSVPLRSQSCQGAALGAGIGPESGPFLRGEQGHIGLVSSRQRQKLLPRRRGRAPDCRLPEGDEAGELPVADLPYEPMKVHQCLLSAHQAAGLPLAHQTAQQEQHHPRQQLHSASPSSFRISSI